MESVLGCEVEWQGSVSHIVVVVVVVVAVVFVVAVASLPGDRDDQGGW